MFLLPTPAPCPAPLPIPICLVGHEQELEGRSYAMLPLSPADAGMEGVPKALLTCSYPILQEAAELGAWLSWKQIQQHTGSSFPTWQTFPLSSLMARSRLKGRICALSQLLPAAQVRSCSGAPPTPAMDHSD